MYVMDVYICTQLVHSFIQMFFGVHHKSHGTVVLFEIKVWIN